jgi:mono/diheme cytochrome c family protein
MVVVMSASLVALAAAVVVVVNVSGDTGRRGLEYMPDMAYSVPYNSFAANPLAADGKTLRSPVPGTVPRGFQPFRYAATRADAVRAGRELRNPLTSTPESIARGRELYTTFCAVCHGNEGLGDGPLVPKIPNPPSYTSARVRSMADGEIFHAISRGSGRMPSYAAQIPYDERWLVVLYVDALRKRGVHQP